MISRSRRSIYALALTLGPLACTDKADADDELADTSEDASDASTSGDTTSEDASTSDDATSAGEVCDAYEDLPGEAVEVVFELVNARSEAIFVTNGSGCVQRPIELEHEGQSFSGLLDACQFTCSEMMTLDHCGCDADCGLPPLVRIEPGERYSTSWTGARYESATMPGSCQAEDLCGSIWCFIREPADAGTYLARARALLEPMACFGEGGEVPCECMPGEPWCLLNANYRIGQEPLQATQEFAHPDAAVVELMFE
jgi:hypothetical protein